MVYDFGVRLRDCRKNKGLSQGDVAKKLKVTRNTISAYERNITTPGLDTMVQIALLYNTSLDYLMGLNNRPSVYLGDLTDEQKQAATVVIDRIQSELKKKKGD